ncbi:MAG TPA: hypothetical protein VGN52_06185 [Burkholderiales bacterium]|jgi:hypothetical protein
MQPKFAFPQIPRPPRANRYDRYAAPGRLVMTDLMLVAALFMAAFWVLDPVQVGFDRLTGIKHLPLLAICGTLVLAVIGQTLFPVAGAQAQQPLAAPLPWIAAYLWPWTLFALAVIVASLYGRFFNGVENSFLNLGLFMLVAPIIAWFALTTAEPARLGRSFFNGLVFVAGCDGLLQLAHFGGETYFHGVEFAVIPLAVYCWFAYKSWLMRILGTGFFLLLAPAEHKNTGFMLALVVVAYCGYWDVRARYRAARDGMARERQVGWGVFMASGLMMMGLAIYALRKLLLPDGNPQYRLYTYEKAWEKFLSSPLIGDAFSGPATERFTLFTVGGSASNVLPTHSDPLDIFANGGVVYGFVFFYGVWRVLRLMLSQLSRADNGVMPECVPVLHGCLAIFLSGIVVYCFNPVLTQPNGALVYWAATGFGVGLALRMRAAAPAPEPARRGGLHEIRREGQPAGGRAAYPEAAVRPLPGIRR